jgi:GLPGLI family protein
MKRIVIIISALFLYMASLAQNQKIISDCTIIFSINSPGSEHSDMGSKTIYIKGKQMRVDLAGKSFKQTLFYNNSTGNVTVLKEIGSSKYIAQYNATEWKKSNHIYDSIKVELKDSVKNILGYNCRQAVLTLKNGKVYTAYYVPGLIPSVMEMPFEAKNIPGLVLEYESTGRNNKKIIYSAQKIDFKPVITHLFDIPKTGYRILH